MRGEGGGGGTPDKDRGYVPFSGQGYASRGGQGQGGVVGYQQGQLPVQQQQPQQYQQQGQGGQGEWVWRPVEVHTTAADAGYIYKPEGGPSTPYTGVSGCLCWIIVNACLCHMSLCSLEADSCLSPLHACMTQSHYLILTQYLTPTLILIDSTSPQYQLIQLPL